MFFDISCLVGIVNLHFNLLVYLDFISYGFRLGMKSLGSTTNPKWNSIDSNFDGDSDLLVVYSRLYIALYIFIFYLIGFWFQLQKKLR